MDSSIYISVGGVGPLSKKKIKKCWLREYVGGTIFFCPVFFSPSLLSFFLFLSSILTGHAFFQLQDVYSEAHSENIREH